MRGWEYFFAMDKTSDATKERHVNRFNSEIGGKKNTAHLWIRIGCGLQPDDLSEFGVTAPGASSYTS